MKLWEVLWVTEGAALIEASTAEEAKEAFYEDLNMYTEEWDAVTVSGVLESYENE